VITAQKIRGRRVAAAAALAVMALGVSGCGTINEQATTINYAASDGMNVDVSDIKARNLMLVTNSADEEARLLGTLVNSTDSAQSLEVEVAGGTVTVDVPAQTSLKLEEDANRAVLPSTGAEPGSLAGATLASGGASSEVRIPVVNGALEEYRQYLPGGYEESTVEHLVPAEEPQEAH